MVAGEQAVIHAGKIYVIELKPFCGMKGHQHHLVGIIRKTVDICDKCNLLKKVLQSRETGAHLSRTQL